MASHNGIQKHVLVLLESTEQVRSLTNLRCIKGPQDGIRYFVVALRSSRLLIEAINNAFPSPKIISVDDLGLDLLAIDRYVLELTDVIRVSTARGFNAFDHALRHDYQRQLFHHLYAERVVEAAIKLASPDIVLLPEVKVTRSKQNQAGDPVIFNLLRREAAVRGIAIEGASPPATGWWWFNLLRFALGNAVSQIRLWSRGWLSPRDADDLHILICNLAYDLGRQFDVRALPKELSDQILCWNQETGEWARLECLLTGTITASVAEPSFRVSDSGLAFEKRRASLWELMSDIWQGARLALVWTLKALPIPSRFNARKIADNLDPSTQLVQLIDASYWLLFRYLEVRRVLKALRPRLLVTSDAEDVIQLAQVLAAQDAGIPQISTSNGINNLHLSFISKVCIADNVCAYSAWHRNQLEEVGNGRQRYFVGSDAKKKGSAV